jgi:hypothetical protein
MHAFLYLFIARLISMELDEGNYAPPEPCTTYLSPDGQESTNRRAGIQHMSG